MKQLTLDSSVNELEMASLIRDSLTGSGARKRRIHSHGNIVTVWWTVKHPTKLERLRTIKLLSLYLHFNAGGFYPSLRRTNKMKNPCRFAYCRFSCRYIQLLVTTKKPSLMQIKVIGLQQIILCTHILGLDYVPRWSFRWLHKETWYQHFSQVLDLTETMCAKMKPKVMQAVAMLL